MMDTKPLIGLGGVLLASMAGDINDQATSIALADMRGALGIGYDAGTWIESLYLSAQPVGMLVSAWFMITLGIKRWTLGVILFVGITSATLPFSPNIEAFYALRILQGLGGGLITPLLMDVALFVLPPSIRIYGLAVYALTATFVPSMTATVAALWVDVLRWGFVFYQAIPLCALGALLVWYGLSDEKPSYGRFRQFDWRGLLLGTLGVVALTTMLFHGDRLDWFNSRLVCMLALVSATCIPLFLLNEWFHPLPFIKLQLLARRNLLYGVVGLFMLIVVLSGSGSVPLNFLVEVDGYRPLQANLITVEIALMQIVLLPAVAFLLDHERVDARVVNLAGFGLIAIACAGCSYVTVFWNRDQFFGWQAVQAVGQAMVVVSLLMLATNAVVAKSEAPFASPLVNFPRSIAEVAAVWLTNLITQWRGHLHSERLVDQIGLDRWRSVQGSGVLRQHPPPLLADGQPRSPGSLDSFSSAVEQQVTVMTTADTFLILCGLTLTMMFVALLLMQYSPPPRIKFPHGLAD